MKDTEGKENVGQVMYLHNGQNLEKVILGKVFLWVLGMQLQRQGNKVWSASEAWTSL
jgi:hypothetical protein